MMQSSKTRKCFHNVVLNWSRCRVLLSDEVDLGGPSPLSAAFYLSKGCFMNGASRWCLFILIDVFTIYDIDRVFHISIIIPGRSYTVGEFNIQQRIILISGGRPTDFTSIGSKDNFTVESNEVNIKFYLTKRIIVQTGDVIRA